MLHYVGSRPSRFQLGDLVEATSDQTVKAGAYPSCNRESYAGGQAVEGVIVKAVNSSSVDLDAGRAQVRLANGDHLWVTAQRVITTRAAREHPLVDIRPVTAYRWTCGGCGDTGTAATEAQARRDHEQHGHHA